MAKDTQSASGATSNFSSSPDRHTFQKEAYIKRKEEADEVPSEDYLDMFEQVLEDARNKWSNPNSKINSMEWDLVTTNWILEKVRECNIYAQHLYAALCNNDFQKLDTMTILKNQKWNCSWRYAGGIVADMQQKGDYINWYCSGIKNGHPDDVDFDSLTEDQKQIHKEDEARVSESVVTDEIRADLKKLGWIVLDDPDDNF
jgi:hypothetical protein